MTLVSSLTLLIFTHHILYTVCSEEFILADGIKVSKLDYNHAKDETSSYKAALKSQERLLEHQLELKEKKLTKDFFPTSCQGKFPQNLCLAFLYL